MGTAGKGFVIVPMFGTHTTKHWYGEYQPLVRMLPMSGIHAILSRSHDYTLSMGCLSLLSVQPNSVIRDRTDYVRMSSRLSTAFAKGVAGYAEEERQRRCRQSTVISR
ncbi:MAG: hypothetical protein SPI30_10875 [Prevotella sp.]|nr:hypothetical protein [Prevotella sp.]